MRPHTLLVIGLVLLSIGMGRPNLAMTKPPPPQSRHQRVPKSCLASLRYRQELHRRVRLLAKYSAQAVPITWTASAPRSPIPLETTALARSSGVVLLQLLMRLQE